jgi:hypothetical protein
LGQNKPALAAWSRGGVPNGLTIGYLSLLPGVDFVKAVSYFCTPFRKTGRV